LFSKRLTTKKTNENEVETGRDIRSQFADGKEEKT
jgi:hypothetical protein